MSNIFLTIIKSIFALLILPIIIASVTVVQGHFVHYPNIYQEFFFWGMLAFLITFLFLYQFWGFYEFGQKAMKTIFGFMSPLNRFMSTSIPFYFTVTMIAFWAIKNFFQTNNYDHHFIFFAGFALTMHILMTAQNLQEQEKTPIKPTYLFTISLSVLINILLSILLMDLASGRWTFPVFFNELIKQTQHTYELILNIFP
ncbi:hypothetical protein MNBD_UNCLBAC01-414 [hydrothermal vent metagenome]|uniref:Uncharacterized protein n=1 Tax=hydrothermal vent metagenome TaxID=652676 RepID=A0A3B1DS78_9ZZZZ